MTGVILKWENDFAARGAAFGRQGVWKKTARRDGAAVHEHDAAPTAMSTSRTSWCILPAIQKHHFINTHPREWSPNENVSHQPGHELVGPEKWKELSPSLQTPYLNIDSLAYGVWLDAPRRSLSATPQVQHVNINAPELLQHFVQTLCPLTTPNGSNKSPFATIILPFALNSSPAVLQALLALSACFRCTSDHSWNQTAIRLKAGVLEFLRKRLETKKTVEIARDAEVLVVTMLMCFYEIINKCDERWVVYLRGARDIVRIRKQLYNKASTSRSPPPLELVFSFAERFFAYQDVIGRTACGVNPMFTSEYWKQSGDNIDLWMGCSPELIEILSLVTELYNTKKEYPDASTDSKFIAKAASLEQRLEELVQTVRDPKDDGLQQSAEVKRLATMLYLYCTIHDTSPSTEIVKSLVQEILNRVTACLQAGFGASLSWPVFVAAVELDPVHDEILLESGHRISGRILILDTINLMSSSTVSNLARTRAVVTKVWNSRDDVYNEQPTANFTPLCALNDWETHVAPYSQYLSLV